MPADVFSWPSLAEFSVAIWGFFLLPFSFFPPSSFSPFESLFCGFCGIVCFDVTFIALDPRKLEGWQVNFKVILWVFLGEDYASLDPASTAASWSPQWRCCRSVAQSRWSSSQFDYINAHAASSSIGMMPIPFTVASPKVVLVKDSMKGLSNQMPVLVNNPLSPSQQ